MGKRNFIGVVCAMFATAGLGQEPKAAIPGLSITNHTSPITAVSFSPDGKQVLTACENDVRIWDATSGKEITHVKFAGAPTSAFSADGKRIGVAANFAKTQSDDFAIKDLTLDKELIKFDPNGGWKPGQSAFRPQVGSILFSPDGQSIATGGSIAKVGGSHGYPGGGVMIWEAKTGKQLHRFELGSFAGTLSYCRDGKILAAGTYGAGGELPAPGEVLVWNTETGRPVHTFKTREAVTAGDNNAWVSSVAISPDGKRVAASVSGIEASKPGALLPHDEQKADILVWDLTTGKLAQTLVGHDSRAGQIAYSPDGKWLVSTAGNDGKLRLLDAATGKESKAIAHGVARVNCINFSPDGKRIAIAGIAENKSGVANVWPVQIVD